MKLNTKDVNFVNFNNQVMNWIKFNGLKIWEAFKNIIVSGLSPLAFNKSVGESLIDYKVYGNSTQNTTPTPATPVEIQCVGDKTKNLCEIGTTTFTQHKSYKLANPIPAGTYTISASAISNDTDGGATCSMLLYDVNGNQVTGLYVLKNGTRGKKTFTANSAIRTINLYASDSWSNGAGDVVTWSDIQIEEGSTSTKYEPYGYKIPVTVGGKNLFDKNNLVVVSNSYVVANSWKATDNGIQYTLRDSNNNGYIILKLGLAKDYRGKTLVFSSPDYYNTNSTLIAVKSADGKNVVHREDLWTQYENGYKSKITVPNSNYTDEIIAVQLYCASMEVGSTITYSNIMVAIADTPQDYEPYIEPITTQIYLDEPLRKINTYSDYIDFENQKVIRKIAYCVFSGQESFSLFTSSSVNYFRCQISNFKYIPNVSNGTNLGTNGLCNYYPIVNSGRRANYTLSAGSSNLYTYDFGNNDFADAASFKADLVDKYNNGNPLIVYIAAYTPTEEAFELPSLVTNKGANTLSVNTEIQPSNIEITYKGK